MKQTKLFSLKSLRARFLKKYGVELKRPKLWQWKRIKEVLSKKEKIMLLFFILAFFCSTLFLINKFYLTHTHFVPAQYGKYTEGIIGGPRFINPIYADANDTDRDLSEILFAGLLKYDFRGKIIPDLASSVELKEEGKKINVFLKPNLFWSDGEKITADDVIFTIKTIQDPDYKSPLRINWLGIKAEKISETEISFELIKSYSAFNERLTLKIIPEHIWQNTSPQNFPFSVFNLKPVGAGPFRFKDIKENRKGFIESITLEPNPFYHGQQPYISKLSFVFFETQKDLIESAKKGKIDGFSFLSSENFPDKDKKLYSFNFPRYFSVFFNLNPPEGTSGLLAAKEIREALNYGTDKEKIVAELLGGKGKVVHSPVLPDIYGFSSPKNTYEFQPEKAKEILENAGFTQTNGGIRKKTIKERGSFQFKTRLETGSRGTEVTKLQECLANLPAKKTAIYPEKEITGYFGTKTKQAVIRFQEKYYEEILKPWGFNEGTGIVGRTTQKKLNEVCANAGSGQETILLKLSLITVKDDLLLKTAELLKEQWRTLGVEIDINAYTSPEIEKDFIKTRNYEMILFGESLGAIPDPFPYWHSSQVKDPGLNLPGYENKTADILLEKSRISMDPQNRSVNYQKFQEIVIEDIPCLFLFSPDFLYAVSNKIKGIEEGIIVNPSKRFLNISDWHIKTKRAWK